MSLWYKLLPKHSTFNLVFSLRCLYNYLDLPWLNYNYAMHHGNCLTYGHQLGVRVREKIELDTPFRKIIIVKLLHMRSRKLARCNSKFGGFIV